MSYSTEKHGSRLAVDLVQDSPLATPLTVPAGWVQGTTKTFTYNNDTPYTVDALAVIDAVNFARVDPFSVCWFGVEYRLNGGPWTIAFNGVDTDSVEVKGDFERTVIAKFTLTPGTHTIDYHAVARCVFNTGGLLESQRVSFYLMGVTAWS